MDRLFGVLVLAGVCIGAIANAPGQEPAKSKPAPPEPRETVVRLNVQAIPAPRPLLKHHLLPQLHELNPGNPVLGYLKCAYGHYDLFSNKKMNDEMEKWEELPLKDLPLGELRGYGGAALREVDDAARLDCPDWQALSSLKSADSDWTDPDHWYDLWATRYLAGALKLRLRAEIAERRFDDALATLQTLFAMSRHMAMVPSRHGNWFSRVTVGIALECLEEMLAQPGCPNLFWALTDLPQPFVDLRPALQGERLLFMKELDLVDDKALTADSEIMKVVDRFEALDHIVSQTRDPVTKKIVKVESGLRNWFNDRVKDQEYVAAARKRLIKGGSAADLVDRLSSLQAVFLAQKTAYVERRDEMFKGVLLPYWQMAATFTEQKAPLRTPTPIWPLTMGKDDLVFARLAELQNFDRDRDSQAFWEQRLALLRCVEALRLHAAAHGRQLPAKLADVELPLPVDQFTGKAFVYKLDGGTASLHGTPPQRYEKSGYYNLRYEVTIAKLVSSSRP